MWLTMTQSSPQHRSRALIVEDEPLCALDLEALMHELGFTLAIWWQMDKKPLCKP